MTLCFPLHPPFSQCSSLLGGSFSYALVDSCSDPFSWASGALSKTRCFRDGERYPGKIPGGIMHPRLSDCHLNPFETISRAVVTCRRSAYENLVIRVFYNAGSSCYLASCAVCSLWVCLADCWPWGAIPCYQLCLVPQMCRRTCCAWADGKNRWSLGAFLAPFGAGGTRIWAPGGLHVSPTLEREGGRRAIQDSPYPPQLLLPLFCITLFWAGGSLPQQV